MTDRIRNERPKTPIGDEKMLHQLFSTMFATVLITAGLMWPGTSTAQEANPFESWTDQQKEEFLQAAEVTKLTKLKVGVTKSQHAALILDGVSHKAHFQSIDVFKPVFQGPQGTELNFRDSYKFNIAAYRLDRLIGLKLVPVSVGKRIRRRDGAATWWIDDALMTERERRREGTTPPNAVDWNDQMYNIRVFNELIYNVDPNLGNVVITEDWMPWPIDFTRSFRRH